MVTFVSSGGVVTGQTSLSVPNPGTVGGAGDYEAMMVWNKLSTVTPTTPAGWNVASTDVVGTGANGGGTGPLRLTTYWRLLDAAPTGNVAVTITGGDLAFGVRHTWRPAAGSTLAFTSRGAGSDTTSGTGYSATGPTSFTLGTADHMIVLTGVTAATTGTTASTTVGGLSVTQVARNGGTNSTTGNDGTIIVYTASTTTARTGTPTFACTLGAASTGGTHFVHITDVAAPAPGRVRIMRSWR